MTTWLTYWPHANIGGLLESAALLVIDTDTEEAHREVQSLGLPPGPISRTGRGYHHFFRAAPGVTGRATRRGASRAIDVLASGIAILPPSRHRSGARYRWLLSPAEVPLHHAPDWATQMLLPARPATTLNIASLPDELPPVALDDLRVSPRVRALIVHGRALAPHRYPSRSECLFAVLRALVLAGHSDADIASILLDSRYAISDKPREQDHRWLAQEIARARAKCQNPSKDTIRVVVA